MCGLQKRQASVNRSFFTTFTARAQKATRSSPRRSLPMPRNALGRGLGALIRELQPKTSPEPAPIHPQATTASGAASAPAREAAHPGPQQVDIDLIEPSPFQPRTRFREEALDELARSIQASGIIQPLVVRPIGSRFQLIAGERRWRAAQRAGLTKAPVIVRQVSDELALEMTLVENIQREDLNAIERHLGTKILLRQRTKLRPGQLVLEYYEDAQLMGLYDRLMK